MVTAIQPPAAAACNGVCFFVITQIHIGTPLEEAADSIHIIISGSNVESGLAFSITGIHLHTVCVEKFHDVITFVLGHNVESCVAFLCAC